MILISPTSVHDCSPPRIANLTTRGNLLKSKSRENLDSRNIWRIQYFIHLLLKHELQFCSHISPIFINILIFTSAQQSLILCHRGNLYSSSLTILILFWKWRLFVGSRIFCFLKVKFCFLPHLCMKIHALNAEESDIWHREQKILVPNFCFTCPGYYIM